MTPSHPEKGGISRGTAPSCRGYPREIGVRAARVSPGDLAREIVKEKIGRSDVAEALRHGLQSASIRSVWRKKPASRQISE
jgi:hypothetical protein